MKFLSFISSLNLFLLMTATLSVTGCIKESETSIMSTPPTSPVSNAKKYLALGDSYTIGQDVAADQRFPAQTVSLLRQMNINLADPQYIATTGWTTSNLMSAINQLNPEGPYDLVTLLIGVNDQYQRQDTGGYRMRFKQLLTKSIELAGNRTSRVIVLSIPDYSVTPFVSAGDKARVYKEIDEFNFINKEVTLQNNVKYLDITASTREAASDRSLIAGDGLHPSGKEYKKWAERLAVLVKPELQ